MSDVINCANGNLGDLLHDKDVVLSLSGYSCPHFSPCVKTQALLWREGYSGGLTVGETVKLMEQMWEQSIQFIEDRLIVNAFEQDLEILRELPFQYDKLNDMMEIMDADPDVKSNRDTIVSAITNSNDTLAGVAFRRVHLWRPSVVSDEAKHDASLIVEADSKQLDWIRTELGEVIEVVPCPYMFAGIPLSSVAVADEQFGVTWSDLDMLATDLRFYASMLPASDELVVDLYIDALVLRVLKNNDTAVRSGAILKLKVQEDERVLPIKHDFAQQTLYSGETEMVINGYTCGDADISLTTQMYLWVNDVPFNTNAATLIECMKRIESESIIDGSSEMLFEFDRLHLQSGCANDEPVKPSISVRNIEDNIDMDHINATEKIISEAANGLSTIQIGHTVFKVKGIDFETTQKHWMTVSGSENDVKALADALHSSDKAEVKLYECMIGGAPLEYLHIAARTYPYERGDVYSAMSTLHKYACANLGNLFAMEGAYHDFLLIAALNSTSSGITWGADIRMRSEEERSLRSKVDKVPAAGFLAGTMSLFDVEEQRQEQEPIPSDIDWNSVANLIERMDYMPLQTEEYCIYCMSNTEGWHKVLNKLGVRVVQEIEPSHAVITTDDLVDEICPHYNHPEGRVMVLLDSVDYFRGADSLVYQSIFWKGDIAIDLRGNRRFLAYV